MVGCYRWCRYVLGDIWTLNSKRQSDRTSLHGGNSICRVKPFWRVPPNWDKQKRLLSNLFQQEKEHSKQLSELLESACTATSPLGSIWSHVIMSVAGSFDEAHKRYGRCDFCRRLLSLSVWGVPIVIAFSPNLTFDPESKHSS